MKALSPQDIIDLANSLRSRGNIGVAFTYNEPLINYEMVLETFKLAKQADLKTVLVTNGTLETSYFEKLLPYTDALNIDLKSFSPSFYRTLFGNLDNVLANIKAAAQVTHVEITTLIIPGKNDSEGDMEDEAQWLASIDENIPLHLSRFFPNYLWNDLPPTPIETLKKLKAVAERYLNTVHLGNV